MRSKSIIHGIHILILILIIAGIMQLCSCAAKEINKTARKDIAVDNQNITQQPDSQDSLQNIEQRKKDLEQILDDNYDEFCMIIDYLEKTTAQYTFRNVFGEITVQCTYNDDPSFQKIDIGDIEVSEQIVYIFKDLGFESIGENDDYISFRMHTGKHPSGGSYWQGLYCNRSSAGENKIQEKSNLPFGENVHIKDEWYYYYGRNNT